MYDSSPLCKVVKYENETEMCLLQGHLDAIEGKPRLKVQEELPLIIFLGPFGLPGDKAGPKTMG